MGKIGIGKGKKVAGGVEETIGSSLSRRSSFDYGDGSKESEIVVLKERRLIPLKPVKEGMQRFNFLLEVCVPGTVPDPQLIGAIIDLVSFRFLPNSFGYKHKTISDWILPIFVCSQTHR